MNPDLLLAHYHEIGLKGRNQAPVSSGPCATT